MKHTKVVAFLGITAWVIAVFSGYAWFIAHQFEAVITPLPPAAYPANAPRPVADLANALMFIHPKCPCTEASLSQLGEIVAKTGGKLATHIFVCVPTDAPADWKAGKNWEMASAIPGADVHVDRGGKLAQLFQAKASGATVVYDAWGQLAFSGGITAQRGHEGPSTGADAVLEAARGGRHAIQSTPVFGCSLFNRDQGASSAP